MDRIPAPERTREKLKALMEGRSEVAAGRSSWCGLAARLIIEESAGRRSEGRVGAPLLRRGAAPAPDIATGIAPVG